MLVPPVRSKGSAKKNWKGSLLQFKGIKKRYLKVITMDWVSPILGDDKVLFRGWSNKITPESFGNCVGTVIYSQLIEDVSYFSLRCGGADEKAAANLLAIHSIGNQFQYFYLPLA